MQLCALDTDDKLVFATTAVKHTDYFCLECNKVVRVRSGFHRQAHFYHLQPNQACRQNGKGMTHLLLQNYLKNCFPEGEVQLECRFDVISRIADVVWIPEKLIFEIQCSPITAAEVAARNADYASLGYQVIWILHESRYNHNRMTAAEDLLRAWPHFFSDMDETGCGTIYDQYSVHQKGMRKLRLTKAVLHAFTPRKLQKPHEWHHLKQQLPEGLFRRAQKWNIIFPGDHIDRCLQQDESSLLLLKSFSEEENALQGNTQLLSKPLLQGIQEGYRRWIGRPYRALLRLWLERACR